jgi:hypothetical protein
LVKRFSSTDPLKSLDLSKLPIAPEWVVRQEPPAATPGHHRFVWDLHYPRPAALDESRATGLLAPPGQYTVELNAAGQVVRQPLTVLSDPRIKVSQADFESQFRLARQVESERVEVAGMLKEASDLKTALQRAPSSPEAASLNRELQALMGPEAPMEGTNGPSTINAISQWLDKLATAVESADGAPTTDTIRGYQIVSAALAAIAPRWRAFDNVARTRIPAK